MTTHRTAHLSLAALMATASVARAQKPPAIRALGPITRVSTDALASIASAVPLADGRVYVNDIVARRVLLFDSTLAKGQVVADSTSVTAKAYGARPGTLIAYRSDSVLFIDPASSSMLVFAAAGKIERTMAMPRASGGPMFNLMGVVSVPGFDATGRLVSFMPAAGLGPLPPKPGRQVQAIPDSSFLVRFDFTTRAFDTVGTFKTPWSRSTIVRDEDVRLTSLEVTPDILPIVDDWVVARDGSIAIVRGRDYHVDWLGADGRWTSSPKMPFDWQRLDDARKTLVIDSALVAIKTRRDSMDAALAANRPLPGAGDGGGRGGRGGGGGGNAGPPPALLDSRPSLADLPDYWPAFARGATRADADGNLWVRTTTSVKGQLVYDIVNRRGELVDRVQLPPFRTIAGFGVGVIYMAVKDASGVVHLERARVK